MTVEITPETRRELTHEEEEELERRAGVFDLIAEIDRKNHESWMRYNAFIESIRPLAPLARAERWLDYAAHNQEVFGEEEAVVYLASRGADIRRAVDSMITRWRDAERYTIERATSGYSYLKLPGDEPPTHIPSKLTPEEATARITELRHFELGDFWYSGRENWPLDAAMLRAVEWCDIGGFDAWWSRFAKSSLADAIQGGAETLRLVYYMFAISRSPLAVRLARRAWERFLDTLEYPIDGRPPWQHLYWRDDRPRFLEQLDYASCLAFASARVRGAAADKDLLTQIGELLISRQESDGAWRTWAGVGEGAIMSTALALHALSVVEVRGRDRAMQRGAEWLWSKQSEYGFWKDGQDAVFMTVLALDAIALANGDAGTTLDPNTTAAGARQSTTSPDASNVPRFDVALSFPGEFRTRVGAIANKLADVLGRQRVLYDYFHQAELARPNLDVYLQGLYDDSRLIVVVLCAEYEKKEWCGIEWRQIRAIMNRGERDIMFLKAGRGKVSGVMPHDGYIDMQQYTDDEITEMILIRADITRR